MASMLQKEDGMRIICNQTDADRESVERKSVGVARSVGDAKSCPKRPKSLSEIGSSG
jgi:hypothetical protein